MRWLLMSVSAIALVQSACSTNPLPPRDAGTGTEDVGVGSQGGGTGSLGSGGEGGSTPPGAYAGDPWPANSAATSSPGIGGQVFTAGQTATTTLFGGTPTIGTPPPKGGDTVPMTTSAVVGSIAAGGATTSVPTGGTNTSVPTGGASASVTTGRTSMGGTTGSASGGRMTGGSSGGGSQSSSTSLPENGTVAFSYGMATGFMSGYGWVDLGSNDLMTSPTCEGTPISKATPCNTTTVWNRPDALCMSGSIPALPASPTEADYENNWGMMIGVNASEPKDPLRERMDSVASVTLTFSGTPTTGARVFIHRNGDPDAHTYCLDSVKSGKTYALNKFNTKCWGDITTVYLTPDDLYKIEWIALGVSSMTSAITVRDFCLEGITFK